MKIHNTVAVINQKGGVGKTTTAATLTAGLTLKGFQCLAIDTDPQGNLSYTVGAKQDGTTVLDVLNGQIPIADAIRKTRGGDIIISSPMLAGWNGTGKKDLILREALKQLKEAYDYIIIDTPPGLGLLTINALSACNSVIIPAQADIYSLQGIQQLTDTIRLVKEHNNPALHISGILLTRYSSRTVLSREIAEYAGKLAERLGTKLYESTIREAVAIKEAQISRQSIFEYAPKSKVTEDYRAFIEEFLRS